MTGARLLFAMRMLPTTLALLLVSGVWVPSYLWLEKEAGNENIEMVCIAAAAMGVITVASGLLRVSAAAALSKEYVAAAEREDSHLLLLTGIFRPRLIVSNQLKESLTAEELAVALRHEEAHARSRDNLKRLLIALSPDAFPFVRGFENLTLAWKRMSEWAADDYAVAGSKEQALTLASALVRAGKISVVAPVPPYSTSLLPEVEELQARVERLIDGPAATLNLRNSAYSATVLMVLAAMALYAPVLEAAHQLWEAAAH